jgi:hypothetical protein
MNNKLGICDNLSRGGFSLLKFLQIILSITVVSLAGYGLITGDFKLQSFMMLFLGLSMLVMGIREFKKGHKGYGWLSMVVFIFILFVSIKSFV